MEGVIREMDETDVRKVEDVNDTFICRRCGRKLKTPEARDRGMGKICWEKSRVTEAKKPLFEIIGKK